MQKRLIIPTLIALIFFSCKEKEIEKEYIQVPSEPIESTKNQKGVVDGSGGNLVNTSFSEFENIVTNDLRYFIRDLVDRSLLYFSYKDHPSSDTGYERPYEKIPDEVQNIFITRKDEIKDVSKKLYFKVKKEPCFSTNHLDSNSDAAISDDGTMCFSYESFKRFKHTELIRKLLIMSMHEITHHLGLDETQAEIIQDFYENSPYGKDLILFNNSLYEAFKRKNSNKTFKLNQIIEATAHRNYKRACSLLTYGYLPNSKLEHFEWKIPNYFKTLEKINYIEDSMGYMNSCLLEESNINKIKNTEKESELRKYVYYLYKKRKLFLENIRQYEYPSKVYKSYDNFLSEKNLDHLYAIKVQNFSLEERNNIKFGKDGYRPVCTITDEKMNNYVEQITYVNHIKDLDFDNVRGMRLKIKTNINAKEIERIE